MPTRSDTHAGWGSLPLTPTYRAAFAAWISARYVDPLIRHTAAEALTRVTRRITVSWHRLGLWLLKHARFKLGELIPPLPDEG